MTKDKVSMDCLSKTFDEHKACLEKLHNLLKDREKIDSEILTQRAENNKVKSKLDSIVKAMGLEYSDK